MLSTKTHYSADNLFVISAIEKQIHQDHKKIACQKKTF